MSTRLRSALYEGVLVHDRLEPRRHRFRRRLHLVYLDLDELDEALARHPFWSKRPWSPVRFRREDYLGPADRPLADAVRDVVEQRTGQRPTGSVRMLTQLRTLGWLFNPITLYWCFDASGEPVNVVAEVTNTPWRERHAYVLSIDDARSGGIQAKALHVSPFMGMEQTYRFWIADPGRSLHVRIENHEAGRKVFTAVLALRRRELGLSSMTDVLWRYPLQTLQVTAGIYLEAAKLLRKGLHVFGHPRRSARPPHEVPTPSTRASSATDSHPSLARIPGGGHGHVPSHDRHDALPSRRLRVPA